jgi:YidC/Oxa1 family membrane protein insertase
MFHNFVVLPIFNLLVTIYALIPGHNFGLALILFTVVIRLLMWPLVKKQLRQAKVTRALQPELKRIKKEAKGDRQKESLMMMELYKERGVNPFGSIPTLIVQMIILFGLYAGLMKVIKDHKQIVDMAYPFLQDLSWLKHLDKNIHLFDNSLLGVVDLARPAIGPKGFYLPAFLLVVGSAAIQFLTSRQLMPTDKDSRKLRDILKDAGDGKQADQSEVSAAVGKNMQYIIPIMVFVFTINLAAALSLYWLVGGLVAYVQQKIALGEETDDLMESVEKPRRTTARSNSKSTPKRPTVSLPTEETDVIRTKSGSKITYGDIPEAEIISNTQITTKARSKKRRRR